MISFICGIQKHQSHRNSRLVVARGLGVVGGEQRDVGQRAQTFSFIMNKFGESNIWLGGYRLQQCLVYLKVAVSYFSRSPVVKNLPSSAGDVGSNPDWELRLHMPQGSEVHTPQLLSPRAANYKAHALWSSQGTAREMPACHNEISCMLQ